MITNIELNEELKHLENQKAHYLSKPLLYKAILEELEREIAILSELKLRRELSKSLIGTVEKILPPEAYYPRNEDTQLGKLVKYIVEYRKRLSELK